MRKSVLAAIGMMIAASQPALGADDQILRAPAPDWVKPSGLLPVPADAAGLMFIRRNDVLVHLDKQGQLNHYGYRIKILHQNALELGNLSIAWNPSAGAPTVHVIKVYRGDAVTDVLKSASFEVLRREDQLEEASLDGILTAVFRVADLRVGDEIEVGVTVRTNDPTLKDIVSGILSIIPEPQPGRFRLELSWAAGQEPNVQLAPDIASLATRTDRSINLQLDNPATLNPSQCRAAALSMDAIAGIQ